MCKITKLLFSVSEQGNPVARLWLDEADTTKNSEAIVLGIRSQVAYAFFLNIGADVETKKSKQYTNIIVNPTFENLFDNYKVSTDPTVKMIGHFLNNAFNNAFSSLEFHKLGEIQYVSKEELTDGICEFLTEKFALEEIVANHMLTSKTTPKIHKNMVKVLEKEDAKQADINSAQEIISRYTNCANREYIQKNNLRMEK